MPNYKEPVQNIETRDYTISGKGIEHPSSIIWYIDCPFCKTEVKAYLWSLAGNGKRCKCGAKFDHYGNARRQAQEKGA